MRRHRYRSVSSPRGRAGLVPAALGGVGRREEWEMLRPMALGDVLQERPCWSMLGEFPWNRDIPNLIPHPAALQHLRLCLGSRTPSCTWWKGRAWKYHMRNARGFQGSTKVNTLVSYCLGKIKSSGLYKIASVLSFHKGSIYKMLKNELASVVCWHHPQWAGLSTCSKMAPAPQNLHKFPPGSSSRKQQNKVNHTKSIIKYWGELNADYPYREVLFFIYVSLSYFRKYNTFTVPAAELILLCCIYDLISFSFPSSQSNVWPSGACFRDGNLKGEK